MDNGKETDTNLDIFSQMSKQCFSHHLDTAALKKIARICFFRWDCNFYPIQRHIFLNIVIDTKRRPLSPPPCLRAGAGLSHRTQLQRYEDGEGTPKTRGFARGAEDLLIPGRLGCPLIVYSNTAGLF